jgi:hypothetical protein
LPVTSKFSYRTVVTTEPKGDDRVPLRRESQLAIAKNRLGWFREAKVDRLTCCFA